ncbi:MAG: GAF domain-containing protein [Chloroflexi bacterium]|nr:GAF domain-containing protein [Chloroflexota bacterium]
MTKKILIVANDFGLIRTIRGVLTHPNISLQIGYSHIDGLYALENGEFDAVVVDAALANHRDGRLTLSSLAQMNQAIPIIGVAAEPGALRDLGLPANVSLVTPTDVSIQQSAMLAVGLEMVNKVVPPPVKKITKPLGNVVAAVAANPLPVTAELPDVTGNSVDKLQTLFALSKSLTEVLDLSEVLNRVVEAARRLTSAEEGMILLPGDESGQLYLRAKVGIDVEVARNFRVKTEDTLAGQVFRSGQPVLIGAQGPQKVKTEYLVNALLYVPINYEGKCIGVLGVNNKSTEAVFDPRHQDLLMNLAAFAAIAIENARIHEEALERTRELQTLVEASQVLNSSLSLDKTLPNICEQLLRVVNVNYAAIHEWDRENNQLKIVARCYRTLWSQGQGPLIDLKSRLVVQYALDKSASPIITRRDAATPDGEIAFLTQSGVDTIQVVPIIGGEQVLGIIQFSYVRPPLELPTAETIHRVQLMTLEVLAMLSSQSNLSKPQGMFRVLENANQLTGADWCEVALLTPDRQSLVTQVAVGIGVWSDGNHPRIDLNKYPDLSEGLETQPVLSRLGDNKPVSGGIRHLFDSTNCRSVVVIPFSRRGQSQGVVVFADSRRSRTITERDIDMGRAVAAQAATALSNAHLLHDLERSFTELKDTQDRLVQTARLSAMGELAAAVAHQINNPLTTIMVDSEMMLLDESPDSQNYKSLQAIHRAGKRASGVARRLLAISRPDDPEAPPERIDVVETIQGVLSLVKAHIERDNIVIESDLPDEPLPSVWAVQGQLDDIWLNLLLNAHDALMGTDGAKLGISASYTLNADYLQVLVWDNGPGIPAKIIDNVFKPFFTTKPVGEGTGLGLHICKQTAERAGGSITVDSKPGQGARFLVLLPVKRGGFDE